MNGLLQSDVLDVIRCNDWDNSTHLTTTTSSLSSSPNAVLIDKYVNNCDRRKLKQLCRSRISAIDPVRKYLWLQLVKGYKKSTSEPRFDEEIADIRIDFPVHGDEHAWKLPSFVDPHYCRYYKLNVKGKKLLQEVLWIIAFKHQEITSCPLLYPIGAIFLHYYSISETLTALTYLLNASSSGIDSKEGPFLLPQSKTQLTKQAYVLFTLANKFNFFPRHGLFFKKREMYKDSQLDDCFLEWLKWIFIGLPFEHVVRIMDCMLVEGSKFLYRVGLTLLLLYKNSQSSRISSLHNSPLSSDLMLSFCEQLKLSPDELISAASRLRRISRKMINKLYQRASNEKNSPARDRCISTILTPNSEQMLSSDSIRISNTLRMAPKYLKTSLIDWYLLDYLWEWIPEKMLIKAVKIIFDSNIDGNSLNTFFNKTENIAETILLVKTTNDEVFGAYCSAPWSSRLTSQKKTITSKFFGTGETFLFTLKPKVAYYPWVGTQESGLNQKKDLPTSCQLFMAASSERITVGAGTGSGLWLDENLYKGKTERCDTFDNKPLCSSGDFTCSVVQVIGFFSELDEMS